MEAAHVPISGAVEGIVDEAIARVILDYVGRSVGTLYPQGGKAKLLEKLGGFNAAARHSPWLVLIDLDQDAECAASFVATVLPSPAEQMVFRVAVRQAEAWLMADRAGLARYLRVSQAHVTMDPDAEVDAKEAMVNIARRSTDKRVRQDMVPTPKGGRRSGPNYSGRLIEFATRHWDLEAAASRSDSLRRCLQRIAV